MKQMHKEFEEESPGLSLRELYFAIFRHQLLIICVAGGIAVVAAAAALFFMKQSYESSANLLVRTGRESLAIDPTAGVGDQIRLRPREEEIRTEMEVIKSREVIDAVVTSLGMDFFLKQEEKGEGSLASKIMKWVSRALGTGGDQPAPTARELQKFQDGLVDSLRNQIEVEPVRSSSIFRVALQGPTPEFAQTFLQKLIAVYLDKHSSMYFTDSAYTFINEKTDRFRNELEQVENEITQFKNAASSMLIQEQRFLDQFATLQQEVRTSESDLASAQAKVKVLQARLSAMPQATGDQTSGDSLGMALDDITRRLSALRIREQELLSTYTDSSIPVQEVRRQIREVQGMLPRFVQRPGSGLSAAVSQQSREGLQMELISEESTVSSLQARLEVQRQKLAELKAQFQDVNENNQALVKMERRRAALEESYKKFSENLQQARIDQSLKLEKISNITIAQQPTYSLQPIKTKKMVVLLLGPIAGLFIALVLAFIMESFDHTIRKPDDIQDRLNIRCLVSLPEFENAQKMIPEMQELPNLTIVPERKKAQSSTTAPQHTNTTVIK
jgi:uncharacterized protein involved in exopolysaccharide biosynthesis